MGKVTAMGAGTKTATATEDKTRPRAFAAVYNKIKFLLNHEKNRETTK